MSWEGYPNVFPHTGQVNEHTHTNPAFHMANQETKLANKLNGGAKMSFYQRKV